MIQNEKPVIANSLWTATANRVPDYPELSGDETADVVVIGGGFSGLSAALHLAEAGVDVTLIEAQQPGWGASGRNGGQVCVGTKQNPSTVVEKFGQEMGERMLALTGDAGDLVYDLIERHNISCDAVRPGWLRPAHTEKTLRSMHKLAEEWQNLGADVVPLDKAEMARLTGTEAYLGGLIDKRGGNLQPLNFALGLADVAERHGATLYGLSPVREIDRLGTGFRVHTEHGSVTADKVLICTNAYTNELEKPLGKGLLPVRSVQVATSPLSDNLRASILPDRHAASDARRLLLYFRLDAKGRFVMGGRGTYKDTSTEHQMEQLRQVSVRMFPQLADTQWEYAWGGFVALTRDRYPHLDELAPGLMAGVGFNGRGVAVATAMGTVLAKWAQGVPEQDLDYPVSPLQAMPLAFAKEFIIEAEAMRMRLLDRLGL